MQLPNNTVELVTNFGKAKDHSNKAPAPYEEVAEDDQSKKIKVFHHPQTVRPEYVAQGKVHFNVSALVSNIKMLYILIDRRCNTNLPLNY